jgi:hypothetical protein
MLLRRCRRDVPAGTIMDRYSGTYTFRSKNVSKLQLTRFMTVVLQCMFHQNTLCNLIQLRPFHRCCTMVTVYVPSKHPLQHYPKIPIKRKTSRQNVPLTRAVFLLRKYVQPFIVVHSTRRKGTPTSPVLPLIFLLHARNACSSNCSPVPRLYRVLFPSQPSAPERDI